MAYRPYSSHTSGSTALGSAVMCLDGVPFRLGDNFKCPTVSDMTGDETASINMDLLAKEYPFTTENAVLKWIDDLKQRETKRKTDTDAQKSTPPKPVPPAKGNVTPTSPPLPPPENPHPGNRPPARPPPIKKVAKKPQNTSTNSNPLFSSSLLTPITVAPVPHSNSQTIESDGDVPVVDKLDISLFDKVDDPFESVELQTINDMEELKNVLSAAPNVDSVKRFANGDVNDSDTDAFSDNVNFDVKDMTNNDVEPLHRKNHANPVVDVKNDVNDSTNVVNKPKSKLHKNGPIPKPRNIDNIYTDTMMSKQSQSIVTDSIVASTCVSAESNTCNSNSNEQRGKQQPQVMSSENVTFPLKNRPLPAIPTDAHSKDDLINDVGHATVNLPTKCNSVNDSGICDELNTTDIGREIDKDNHVHIDNKPQCSEVSKQNINMQNNVAALGENTHTEQNVSAILPNVDVPSSCMQANSDITPTFNIADVSKVVHKHGAAPIYTEVLKRKSPQPLDKHTNIDKPHKSTKHKVPIEINADKITTVCTVTSKVLAPQSHGLPSKIHDKVSETAKPDKPPKIHNKPVTNKTLNSGKIKTSQESEKVKAEIDSKLPGNSQLNHHTTKTTSYHTTTTISHHATTTISDDNVPMRPTKSLSDVTTNNVVPPLPEKSIPRPLSQQRLDLIAPFVAKVKPPLPAPRLKKKSRFTPSPTDPSQSAEASPSPTLDLIDFFDEGFSSATETTDVPTLSTEERKVEGKSDVPNIPPRTTSLLVDSTSTEKPPARPTRTSHPVCSTPDNSWSHFTPLPAYPKVNDDPYNRLSEEAKTFIDNLEGLGFPRARIARAVERFGQDDKVVVDHLCLVNKLSDMGHKSGQAEIALQLYGNSYDQACKYLELFQQFQELGFSSDKIRDAIYSTNINRDKALDVLTMSS